ncbi:echinoidin-like [Amphiura filiformis]|uniref:echinoidin-like n=1 Tax=Amphiura filiformis TaxID=82378 RepID=UPI003B20C29B
MSVAMHILRTLIAYSLVLATLTAPYSRTFPKTNGGCYPLWSRFHDYCYRYFGDPMTWQRAEDYCQRYDVNDQVAHLVSIHGKKEQDFVYEMWQSTIIDPGLNRKDFEPKDVNRANGLWIGLEDQEEESHWHWTDNSTTHGFDNWRWYEPDNEDEDRTGVGEDCVHIYQHTYPWFWWYGDWNDVKCDRVMPFVCKMPIDL